MADPFSSSTVSIVLSWILIVPTMFVLWEQCLKVICPSDDEDGGFSRLFAGWLALCVLVFSPFRYMLLQIVLAESYSVQSVRAFLSTFLLALYVPFVFGLLYLIGVGLPLFTISYIAGQQGSRTRRIVASIATPFLCAAGYSLFFALLPYAAWTIQWISDRDVLSATNGPASYFYRYVVEPDVPRIGPQQQRAKGEDATARFRHHLAATYVSPKKNTARHFALCMRYSREATQLVNQGGAFSIMPSAEAQTMIELRKAALHEAGQASIELLNERASSLGDMLRDQFIPGTRTIIQAYEKCDNRMLRRGLNHLDQWGEWYNAHLQQIRNAE